MNEALLKQIDQEIENVREVLARDTIHLIGVRSVKGEPEPGAPFGPGPRAMLDAGVSAIYTDQLGPQDLDGAMIENEGA